GAVACRGASGTAMIRQAAIPRVAFSISLSPCRQFLWQESTPEKRQRIRVTDDPCIRDLADTNHVVAVPCLVHHAAVQQYLLAVCPWVPPQAPAGTGYRKLTVSDIALRRSWPRGARRRLPPGTSRGPRRRR